MLGFIAELWPMGVAGVPEGFWAYRDPVQKCHQLANRTQETNEMLNFHKSFADIFCHAPE